MSAELISVDNSVHLLSQHATITCQISAPAFPCIEFLHISDQSNHRFIPHNSPARNTTTSHLTSYLLLSGQPSDCMNQGALSALLDKLSRQQRGRESKILAPSLKRPRAHVLQQTCPQLITRSLCRGIASDTIHWFKKDINSARFSYILNIFNSFLLCPSLLFRCCRPGSSSIL